MEHWAQIAFLSALRDFIKFTGLKKPAVALIPLRQHPSANFNADDPNSRAMTSTPACGDENADSFSECGNDGHPDDDDDSTAITGKDYTQLQFWNYVDNYLNLIHTNLFQDVADPVTRFFKEALQIDIFNYKGSTKIPPPPSKDLGPLPAWQEALRRRAHSVLPPITYAYMGKGGIMQAWNRFAWNGGGLGPGWICVMFASSKRKCQKGVGQTLIWLKSDPYTSSVKGQHMLSQRLAHAQSKVGTCSVKGRHKLSQLLTQAQSKGRMDLELGNLLSGSRDPWQCRKEEAAVLRSDPTLGRRQRRCLHEHWKNCHDYPEAHTWESRAEEDIEEEAVRVPVAVEDDSYLAYDEACKVRQLVSNMFTRAEVPEAGRKITTGRMKTT
ncbi:hypothetical protein EI94DRAFT_1706654 [Lactarius quietus]|nr:hypothetical protein EI94DRAFT_1706654 [Lactarius quietus]